MQPRLFAVQCDLYFLHMQTETNPLNLLQNVKQNKEPSMSLKSTADSEHFLHSFKVFSWQLFFPKLISQFPLLGEETLFNCLKVNTVEMEKQIWKFNFPSCLYSGFL